MAGGCPNWGLNAALERAAALIAALPFLGKAARRAFFPDWI